MHFLRIDATASIFVGCFVPWRRDCVCACVRAYVGSHQTRDEDQSGGRLNYVQIRRCFVPFHLGTIKLW